MTSTVHAVTAALIAAALPIAVPGQSTPNEPVKTALCELAQEPERFNGKMVEVRAGFVSRFQWEGFVDESCSAKLQIGVEYPLDDLKPEQGQYAFTTVADDNEHPERLDWKPIPLTIPVHLKRDGNYRILRKYADAKFRWADGGVCRDCPLHRINVTATGRFDHFETGTVAVRPNPSTKAYQMSAAPEAPLSRFVLESVSDVTATPVDPAVYSATGLREISLEEANELLTAYLKLPEGNLLKSGDMGYTGFYFFMAILGASKGPVGVLHVRYDAVDRKTGDVWNGVICQQIASHSLKKLQLTLRRRIGLTDDEYQKAKRPGPMCESGMPRVEPGK